MFTFLLVVFVIIVIGEARNLYVHGEPDCPMCNDTGAIEDEEWGVVDCYYCDFHNKD